MTDKWICIHGHFYQPPRENPWLEAVEPQPAAHPYRDWNERVTAECYRPNAAARVVDNSNQIIAIVDNYQRMSFDVGPTLMSWLADQAPDVHDALIAADRASCAPFDPALKLNQRIKAAAFNRGLACYPAGGTMDGRSGDHVLLAPPYITTSEDIDMIVDRLGHAVDSALKSVGH